MGERGEGESDFMTNEGQKPAAPPNEGNGGSGGTGEAEATDVNRLVRERHEKAARLAESGMTLYPGRFTPSTPRVSIEQTRARADELLASGEDVTLAGRVLIVRAFGKAGFLVVRDGSGRPGEDGRHSGQIQFYVKQGVTSEAGFEYYKHGLDGGDVIGATGRLFKSKTGELTLEAKELTLLAKSVRPLPEKWHGLTDVDLRHRQRYVDLIVNPQAREVFVQRSRIIGHMRRYLESRGYLEVETPMMQPIYGGAAAKPFVTHHNALDMDLYLRIAPELYLKRLVVGGFEKVFEINRNFRNEGISTRHNPEFTMMELYTAWWDYTDTMDLCEDLYRTVAAATLGTAKVPYQGEVIDLESPIRRLPILDAVAGVLDMDVADLKWGMKTVQLRTALLKRHPSLPSKEPKEDFEILPKIIKEFWNNILGPKIENTKAKSGDKALMDLFELAVEPTLIQPTFVIDYPKSLCPLAKSKAGDPATAERFELFVAGMEMGNAYSEMNDPLEQLEKFMEQKAAREGGDEEAMNQIDHDYIRALEYGMPPVSGLGLGIDRMAMLLTDSASIRDVILFPTMRPEA
jgi:lysyl-tRNA synthetase class 2